MSKLNTTLFIIAICIAVVLGARSYLLSGSLEQERASKRVKGDENAALLITEYIDFQCPSCAYGAKYISDTMAQYPGLIRLELRHFPLRMHKHAIVAARYAECTLHQDKFWEFHDKALAQQSHWRKLVNALPAFDALIKEIGVDDAAFRSCLADEKIVAEINQHKAEGKALGISSTPTYFVNGEMIVGAKSLRDIVEKHISK